MSNRVSCILAMGDVVEFDGPGSVEFVLTDAGKNYYKLTGSFKVQWGHLKMKNKMARRNGKKTNPHIRH